MVVSVSAGVSCVGVSSVAGCSAGASSVAGFSVAGSSAGVSGACASSVFGCSVNNPRSYLGGVGVVWAGGWYQQ